MKPFEKFLTNNSNIRNLLDTYLELRQHFQELGFSEEDLEKPPMYSPKMMTLFASFGRIQKALFNQLNDYGFDVDEKEFRGHIQSLLQKINELTPLSDVNYKRRNKRDEDN